MITKKKSARGTFANTIVDLGLVVRDLQTSIEFYTEVIGFTEIVGFDVPTEIAGDSGLTDYLPLEISVLRLGVEDGTPSSLIKLMQVSEVETVQAPDKFIHSHYGINYITLFVNDMDAAMTRLDEYEVEPLVKGRIALPLEISIGAILRNPDEDEVEDAESEDSMPEGVYMVVVKDPDGNFVEIIGP